MTTTAKIKAQRERAQEIVRGTSGEPIVTNDNYREEFGNALNWYNANCDDKDVRKYAQQYIKSMNLKQFDHCVSKASYIEIKTIGTVGRLILRGQHVDLDHVERILTMLADLKAKYTPQQVVQSVSVVQPSIQDRMAEQAGVLSEEIDVQIDNFVINKATDFSARNYLLSQQVSGPVAKKIGEIYKPLVKELVEAVDGDDDQLKEGYSHFTKPQLKKFMAFIQSIVDDCNQQAVSARAQRKPRARKVKPASQIVSKMKYMKEYEPLKLKSINPATIIGSTELWVYAPEKRKLTVFRGADGGELSVSGMSITNYDVSKSETKTLRKPEEFFKGLSLGKRSMANAWKSVKAKVSNPRSRINEEMILLAAN